MINRNIIQWGKITSVTYKSGNNIFVNVSTFANSNYRDIPLVQDYGLASIPAINTRCVLIALNADDDSLICIATGSSKVGAGLAKDDVLISSDGGASIKVNKEIEISGNTNIAGDQETEGKLKVTDNITAEKDVMIKGMLTVMTAAVSTLMVGTFAGPPPPGGGEGPGPFAITASSLSITANGINLIDVIISIVDYLQNPPTTAQERTNRLNSIRSNLNSMKGS